MQRVLQIGWQRQASEALRSLGCEVDVVVNHRQARRVFPDGQYPDDVTYCGDYVHVEELLSALGRRLARGGSYDRITSFSEMGLLPAAMVSRALGAAGPELELVLRMRDKALQKECVRHGGVPCADFTVLENLFAPVAVPEEMLPAVLKPVAGASARNTYRISDARELESVRADLGRRGMDQRTFLLERFEAGAEYHFDGWLEEGELSFCSLGKYGSNLLNVRYGAVACSRSVDLVPGSPFAESALGFLRAALRALGYDHGFFHLEAFLPGDGTWVFSECAMRAGGAGIPMLLEWRHGIPAFRVAAELALGRPVSWREPAQAPAPGQACGFVLLPAPAGTLRRLPPLRDLQRLPGVAEARYTASPGDRLPPSTTANNVGVGLVVLAAATAETYDAHLQGLLRWFGERVEVARAGEGREAGS